MRKGSGRSLIMGSSGDEDGAREAKGVRAVMNKGTRGH